MAWMLHVMLKSILIHSFTLIIPSICFGGVNLKSWMLISSRILKNVIISFFAGLDGEWVFFCNPRYSNIDNGIALWQRIRLPLFNIIELDLQNGIGIRFHQFEEIPQCHFIVRRKLIDRNCDFILVDKQLVPDLWRGNQQILRYKFIAVLVKPEGGDVGCSLNGKYTVFLNIKHDGHRLLSGCR